MNSHAKRRPSADPEVLCHQLLRELMLLDQGSAQEPALYQAYLRQLIAQVWARVSQGDLAAPGQLLQKLLGVQAFLKTRVPAPQNPLAEAVREVQFLVQNLLLAERSLRPAEVETRLKNRQRSLAEREVLRILLENRGEYLRRGEVHAQMRMEGGAPTGPRVGQILVDLHHEGLLLRIHGSAQGNPSSSFYMLSEAGIKACDRIGISPSRSAEPPLLFASAPNAWQDLLVASKLGVNPSGSLRCSRRITAFYSYRGGVGRSLAVAHCGFLIARKRDQQREHPDFRVLVIDMDLEAPSLDYYFQVPPGCRGFKGLWEGYWQQAEGQRKQWLAKALSDPSYVAPTELPGLFYLPSGFGSANRENVSSSGEIFGNLLTEIASQPKGTGGVPRLAQAGFLGDLRSALHAEFAQTLVDAPAGLGPISYLSTTLWADELIICTRASTEAQEGLRRVVGHFLLREDNSNDTKSPLVVFAFTPLFAQSEVNGNRWIEKHVLSKPEQVPLNTYRVVRFYFSPALADDTVLLVDEKGHWDPSRRGDGLLVEGYRGLADLIGSEVIDPALPANIDRSMDLLLAEVVPRTSAAQRRSVQASAGQTALAEIGIRASNPRGNSSTAIDNLPVAASVPQEPVH